MDPAAGAALASGGTDQQITMPRGPVAGMYTSPGPCYALPSLVGTKEHDPRSHKNKAPAYSFGNKHGEMNNDESPGPVYLPDAKIDRFGKDGTPQYSLYSRKRLRSAYKNPAPGDYAPEHAGPSAKYRHPAYTFGSRTRHRHTDKVPASNTYLLPNVMGPTKISNKKQSPIYTMRPKYSKGAYNEDLKKTPPGPAKYDAALPDNYKTAQPQFSFGKRTTLAHDKTKTPGPGNYNDDKLFTVVKKKAPAFSFGVRHSPYTAPVILEVLE